MKAIIVGAGLAGCSAAFKLSQAGWEVTILEQTSQVGGRARTTRKNGYVIDSGASAIATSYSAYLSIVEALGMQASVVPANPFVGIAKCGSIIELDMNHIKWSGIATNLLSLKGKLTLFKLFRDVNRAKNAGMLNYDDLSKAAPIDTESVAQYAARRLSEEAYNYFCDPLTRVMLLSNSDKISKVEFFSAVSNILDQSMMGIRGGQQEIPKRLVQGLDVRFESKVISIEERQNGVVVKWSAKEGVEEQEADACVVACYLSTATEICVNSRQILEPLNRKVRYTKAISVSIGIAQQLLVKSFMFLVPQCEHEDIAAIFIEHNKVQDRAPPGHALFTVYFEENASENHWEMPDDKLAGIAIDYLATVFGDIRDKVDMTHVEKWSTALPVMEIGSYSEVAMLNENLKANSPIQFAGDYLSGAGQNTAVEFGVRAATNIIGSHSG